MRVLSADYSNVSLFSLLFKRLFTKNWHRPSLGSCSTRKVLNVKIISSAFLD